MSNLQTNCHLKPIPQSWRRQVVNPWQQTPKGQSVAKPWSSPVQKKHNWEYKCDIKESDVMLAIKVAYDI